jgi:hypothetical protein
MVAHLGMTITNPAIELSAQDQTGANSRANGHIDQTNLSLPGPPDGLTEGRRVSIVFHRRPDVELY